MHFEQSAILTVHTHVITRNPRITVSHDNLRTWFLHINNVQKEDRGRYMCQINTANAKTQIGYLHVVGKHGGGWGRGLGCRAAALHPAPEGGKAAADRSKCISAVASG